MGHSAFAFWFWVVGDHPSRIRLMSHHSQSRQSKQSWHVEQSLHATAPPHAPDDPDTPTHPTHNGRLSRTIGHRAANNSPHRWGGGRIPHTPEQHRHLTRQRSLDVAGALPSVLSPFQRRRAATRRAEPVSAGDLGAARDAGMRDGSVGSVPKADRLGCELRKPPFLYPLDHVQAVGGRAGWPRAGGGEGVRR